VEGDLTCKFSFRCLLFFCFCFPRSPACPRKSYYFIFSYIVPLQSLYSLFVLNPSRRIAYGLLSPFIVARRFTGHRRFPPQLFLFFVHVYFILLQVPSSYLITILLDISFTHSRTTIHERLAYTYLPSVHAEALFIHILSYTLVDPPSTFSSSLAIERSSTCAYICYFPAFFFFSLVVLVSLPSCIPSLSLSVCPSVSVCFNAVSRRCVLLESFVLSVVAVVVELV